MLQEKREKKHKVEVEEKYKYYVTIGMLLKKPIYYCWARNPSSSAITGLLSDGDSSWHHEPLCL